MSNLLKTEGFLLYDLGMPPLRNLCYNRAAASAAQHMSNKDKEEEL